MEQFQPWLATMSHHRSVDWVRQETHRRRREHRSLEAQVDHRPGVDATVASTIEAERVRHAVDELCEPERTPICLAYFGHRTYREVAEDLGVAEGTIKSRIRAGLQHLAVALRSDRGDPADLTRRPGLL